MISPTNRGSRTNFRCHKNCFAVSTLGFINLMNLVTELFLLTKLQFYSAGHNEARSVSVSREPTKPSRSNKRRSAGFQPTTGLPKIVDLMDLKSAEVAFDSRAQRGEVRNFQIQILRFRFRFSDSDFQIQIFRFRFSDSDLLLLLEVTLLLTLRNLRI